VTCHARIRHNLTGEVPYLVQYDSVHKLFIVGEANRMRSDIQVFDPIGNLIETLTGFQFHNRIYASMAR
jgi:hypothetical protein